MTDSELGEATLLPFVTGCVSLSLQTALHRFNPCFRESKEKAFTVLVHYDSHSFDPLQDANEFADKLHVHLV